MAVEVASLRRSLELALLDSPVVVLNSPPGTGKSPAALTLLSGIAQCSEGSPRDLKRNVAELDWLHSSMTIQDDQAMAVWLASTAITAAADTGTWSADLPIANALTTSVTELASDTDRSYFFNFGYSSAPASPPFLGSPAPVVVDTRVADAFARLFTPATRKPDSAELVNVHDLPLLEPVRLTSGDADKSVVFAPLAAPDLVLATVKALLQDLRLVLLRVIGSARAFLHLMLLRVRTALSRCSRAVSFVLLVLATVRCFGHRDEPDDHALPVLMPMSVIIGEVTRHA